MKLASFLLLFHAASKAWLGNASAVRAGVCLTDPANENKLRIFVQHNEGVLTSTPDVEFTVHVSRNILFIPKTTLEFAAVGYLNGVPEESLPGCFSPLREVRACPDVSSTNNNWVYFDADFSDFCDEDRWVKAVGSTDDPIDEGCDRLYGGFTELTFSDCVNDPITPEPTPAPTPAPTPQPTPGPTPGPTPTPTAAPIPAPAPTCNNFAANLYDSLSGFLSSPQDNGE